MITILVYLLDNRLKTLDKPFFNSYENNRMHYEADIVIMSFFLRFRNWNIKTKITQWVLEPEKNLISMTMTLDTIHCS